MANRSGVFRPRRGKRSTAIARGIVLKRGEVFFELPDSGVGTGAGKLVMGDGATAYEDLPYFSGSGGSGSGEVRSVNNILPDKSGNIELTTVPYAENLKTADNIEQSSAYIFRTSGGSADIEAGEANLDKIKGNCEIKNGVIYTATPNAFKSIGLNQFNRFSMVLADYTISDSGIVTSEPGSFVCYVHAVGGLSAGYIVYDPNHTIIRVGWCANIPRESTVDIYVDEDGDRVTSLEYNSTVTKITTTYEGYICIACTNVSQLTVHPRWSGLYDTTYAPYSESVINIPLVDINRAPLPTADYGMPSVNEVRDEINFAQRRYIQRIGCYPYSLANLDIVEALGTDYIYDNAYIFYVLKNVVEYALSTSVSPNYVVSDYGTEEFLGTVVPVLATSLYGQNLKDKLRRDVVTISEQNLLANERAQVRTNIDAAQNYLQFNEAEDMSNERLLSTIISGNPMNTLFGATKRLLRRLDSQVKSKVNSVNYTLPDRYGNVEINRVSLADNIYSPENKTYTEEYIYRTSGGRSDIQTGVAQLSFLRGFTTVKGRVEENIEGQIISAHQSGDPDFDYPSLVIDPAGWRNSTLGGESGAYIFMYNGTNWVYQSRTIELASFGLTVIGTVTLNDIITINYIKGVQGALCTIKPDKFTSTGLNLFDKDTMSMRNYTISSNGTITASVNMYVIYCKAPFSDFSGYVVYDPNNSIIRVGYLDSLPEPGKTVDTTDVTLDTTLSVCIVPESSANSNVGYICVACTDPSEICIHPRWSGSNDTVTEPYEASIVNIPTEDSNGNELPYIEIGLASVGSIADEINFDLKQYIKRIGYLPYSEANLEEVKSYGVDYDYDSRIILYVLPEVIKYTLSDTISNTYNVNDYGVEYFDYSVVLGLYNDNKIYASQLYGENLRDKLRRDVLTISSQTLSEADKTQIRDNIGAASAAEVAAISSDLSNVVVKPSTYTANNFIALDNFGNVVSTIYDQNSFAAAVHSQSADYITAGTLAGKVMANQDAVSVLGNAQVRNIYAGTTDLTAGVSALATGDIYIVYEE